MTTLEFATQIGPTHMGWCYSITVDGEIWQEDTGHTKIPCPWPAATWPWLSLGYGLRWLADSPCVFPAVRVLGPADVVEALAGRQQSTDSDVAKVLARCQQLMKRKPCSYEYVAGSTPYLTASVQAAWESAAPKPFRTGNLPKVPRVSRQQ